MANLDNLPSLALRQIFDFLSIDNLFRLRVCKSLKSEIESLNHKDLYLYQGPYQPHKRWYYPIRLVGYQNSFQVTSPLEFICSPVCKKYFKNVKNLLIQQLPYGTKVPYESHLNDYKQLEQLELNCSFNCATVLKLPRLKAICFGAGRKKNLNFETPNLEVMVCKYGPGDRVNLSGHKLKYFEGEDLPKNIADFKELETIVAIRLGEFQPNLLEQLPKLTEVNIYTPDFNRLNEIVQSLIKKKRDLNRKDLRIIGSAFEELITGNTPITLYYRDTFYIDKWAMQDIRENYSKFVFGTHFETGINYTKIYQGFNSRIPTDFHRKITNINYVDVQGIQDADAMLDFLSKSPTITAITFDKAELNRDFLWRLSVACPALGQLIMKQSKLLTADGWIGNHSYRFLSNLACLTSLYLFSSPCFYIELIENLFTRCKYFKTFSANDIILNVRIERNPKSKQFELNVSEKKSQCKNLDEVIRLLAREPSIRTHAYHGKLYAIQRGLPWSRKSI